MTANYMMLIDEIKSGSYDSDLVAIKDAIAERLVAVRRTKTIKDFKIGDKVKFNDFCGTKYMQGESATVVGLGRSKLTVFLDRPVGRFYKTGSSGIAEPTEVSVPPSIVDLVK